MPVHDLHIGISTGAHVLYHWNCFSVAYRFFLARLASLAFAAFVQRFLSFHLRCRELILW